LSLSFPYAQSLREITLSLPHTGYGRSVADGYEVDPEALRTASGGFHVGADAVTQAARQLQTAQLVPGALGEVDAAYELATAFAEFAGRHADDLLQGADYVTETATGLVTNADEYRRREDFRL
jgi:hypothetical protein